MTKTQIRLIDNPSAGGDLNESFYVTWPNSRTRGTTTVGDNASHEGPGNRSPSSIHVKPLHYAALQDDLPLLKLLLNKGADPNLGTRDLPPPLAIMVGFDNELAATELVLAGANPYQPTSLTNRFNDIMANGARVGDAPIHIACRSLSSTADQDKMITMLDKLTSLSTQAPSGAMVLNGKGRNLLCVAASSNLPKVCSWILDQRFGPPMLNYSGSKPPMFEAIEQVSGRLSSQEQAQCFLVGNTSGTGSRDYICLRKVAVARASPATPLLNSSLLCFHIQPCTCRSDGTEPRQYGMTKAMTVIRSLGGYCNLCFVQCILLFSVPGLHDRALLFSSALALLCLPVRPCQFYQSMQLQLPSLL